MIINYAFLALRPLPLRRISRLMFASDIFA